VESEETVVARQWIEKHVSIATNTLKNGKTEGHCVFYMVCVVSNSRNLVKRKRPATPELLVKTNIRAQFYMGTMITTTKSTNIKRVWTTKANHSGLKEVSSFV
jgi:hypothetical protein